MERFSDVVSVLTSRMIHIRGTGRYIRYHRFGHDAATSSLDAWLVGRHVVRSDKITDVLNGPWIRTRILLMIAMITYDVAFFNCGRRIPKNITASAQWILARAVILVVCCHAPALAACTEHDFHMCALPA